MPAKYTLLIYPCEPMLLTTRCVCNTLAKQICAHTTVTRKQRILLRRHTFESSRRSNKSHQIALPNARYVHLLCITREKKLNNNLTENTAFHITSKKKRYWKKKNWCQALKTSRESRPFTNLYNIRWKWMFIYYYKPRTIANKKENSNNNNNNNETRKHAPHNRDRKVKRGSLLWFYIL